MVGKFTPSSLSSEFIDFSTSFYDDGGITLMVRRPDSKNSLFMFTEVFDWKLWLSIFGAIVGTGTLVFIFDHLRPLKKKKEASADSEEDDDKYQFDVADSFWAACCSFTLSGGVNPPKSGAVCILLASFWLFCAIVISTYQANLSALLTASKLKTQITSLKKLVEQTSITYTAIGKFIYK